MFKNIKRPRPPVVPVSKSIASIYIVLILVSISLTGIVRPQTITFQKTIVKQGHEVLRSVIQKPDNGYIAVGDIQVIRFDAYGDTVWTRVFQGVGYCVIKTNDGNYAMCDLYGRFVKFDINGNVLVNGGMYNDDTRTLKLVQNSAGDYFLAGGHFSNHYMPYLVKLNQNGVFLWDSVYSNGFYDGNIKDILVSDNKLVLTGYYAPTYPSIFRMFIMMVNFNGERISFNPGYDVEPAAPYSIIESASGSFVICGSFRSNDPFIAKYNSLGAFQWIKTFDTTYSDPAMSITFDKEGNYVHTGVYNTNPRAYSEFVRIRKTDTNGVELWSKTHGLTGHDQIGLDIKCTSDSGFVIAGVTATFSQGDIYLLKTDKNGDTLPPIGIVPISTTIPNTFEFRGNYPNPFNPVTKLEFDIPSQSSISLMIYDILGREVERLLNETLKPGEYSISFNAARLPSGIYFARLTASSDHSTYTKTQNLVLVK